MKKAAGIEFATVRVNLTILQCEQLMFSDEFKFDMIGSDGRKYLRKRLGEELKCHCIIPTVEQGGGLVSV